MTRTIRYAAILVLLTGALPRAQEPKIRIGFDDGLVTIAATEALVGDLLAEWARVGGTVITGADRLPDTRVTVNLVAEPERRALDAVIGSAAGYISTVRPDAPAGQSLLGKLQIVLSSEAAPARATRVIDMNIPESRFEYTSPIVPEDPDGHTARPAAVAPPATPAAAAAAAAAAQIMPEMRFQFVEPMILPLPEPEAPPDAKPDPRTKKPPSGR